MRKNKFLNVLLCCLFAAMALVTTSCSEDTYEKDSSEKYTTQSELIGNLTRFNNSVQAYNMNTRASVSDDTKKIIIADIAGAFHGARKGYKISQKVYDKRVVVASTLLGGVIYGGYRSWKAYKDIHKVIDGNLKPNIDGGKGGVGTVAPIKPFGLICAVLENGKVNTTAITNGNTVLTKQLELDNKVLTSVNLTQDQLNIGKLHNLLLAAYEGKIPLQNAYKIETNDENIKTAINSKEMAELCSKIGAKDESIYFSANEPLPNKVMELFNEVFKETVTDNYSVVRLINKYEEEIEKTTELTEEQKNSIRSGLATALYSFNYWNNK